MTTSQLHATDLGAISGVLEAVETNIAEVVRGKRDVIRLALIALVAEGHLLVEDVPGVGKTLLAKALARSVDCTVSRIQFTPDLLPSDVTGLTVYSPETGAFRFRPGPVFANIVVADEINRATPKTQSALLEAMEERTVTVDGVTHELARPFLVVATQNPVELEGTYPLPEAQRDRFLMRIEVGYPHHDDELTILRTQGTGNRLDEISPVTDAHSLAAAIATVHAIHTAESVERYIVAVTRATRGHADVDLGASPRATLALARAARAAAALDGRSYVTPDDVKRLATPVLAHRLVLSPRASLASRGASDVIADILDGTPAPTAAT